VTVEYNDTMLLGEVVACTQDCNQHWHLEFRIEQVLTGLQSLMLLRERLLGEGDVSRSKTLAATAQRS
jgi:hypothetical protein